jgi:hypothetical protein
MVAGLESPEYRVEIMNRKDKVGFAPTVWHRVKDHLEKHLVGGVKLNVRYQRSEYFSKKSDMVILDEMMGVSNVEVSRILLKNLKIKHIYWNMVD